MEKLDISIRTATPDDAEELLAIYAQYVENTAVTFEYSVPSEAEFRRRIENTLKKYWWQYHRERLSDMPMPENSESAVISSDAGIM